MQLLAQVGCSQAGVPISTSIGWIGIAAKAVRFVFTVEKLAQVWDVQLLAEKIWSMWVNILPRVNFAPESDELIVELGSVVMFTPRALAGTVYGVVEKLALTWE